MAKLKTYKCLSPINKKQKLYKVGDIIELDAAEALILKDIIIESSATDNKNTQNTIEGGDK